MSGSRKKTIAIILLILIFLPAIAGIILAILVHPTFLLLLLVLTFTIPLIRAARG